MLNCVYHPIDDMRVVDDLERDRLLGTGHWYDSPYEAKMARKAIEDEIKQETPQKRRGRPKAESKL